MNVIQYVRTSIEVIILMVICSVSEPKNISKVTSLRAVTQFDGIEQFHYRLYETKAGTEPQESSDPSIRIIVRQEICEKVLSSPYYKILRQVKGADVEERETALTLHDDYRTIFDALFQPVEGFHKRFKYANPYRLATFLHNGERREEHTFVCVARRIEAPRNIEVYLVSREYDVNLVSGRSPITGRFIFAHNGSNWKAQALAEESAISSEFIYKAKTVEFLYIKHRQVHTELGPAEMDPVCKLSRANKLRLCVSIFASKILRRNYKFTPHLDHVEDRCVTKLVSFAGRIRVRLLLKMKRKHYNKRRDYEELVIGCNAIRKGSNDRVTYYVSRGDVKNSVFAYKYYISDRKILVKHYFKNVSVVDSTSVNMLNLSTGQKEEETAGVSGGSVDGGQDVNDTEGDASDDGIEEVDKASSLPVSDDDSSAEEIRPARRDRTRRNTNYHNL